MTIKEIRTTLDEVRAAASEFAAHPSMSTTVLMLDTAGQFAYRLMAVGVSDVLVRNAEEVICMICTAHNLSRSWYWTIVFPDGREVEVMLPRPTLRGKYIIAFDYRLMLRLKPYQAERIGPLLGWYVLLLCALARRVDGDRDARADKVAHDLFRITREVTAERLVELADSVTQAAEDLFWEWRKVRSKRPARQPANRDVPGTPSENKVGIYATIKDVPSGFFKDDWLTGTKRRLATAMRPNAEPQDKVIDDRAASGVVALVCVRGQEWQMFSRSKQEFKKHRENFERFLRPPTETK